jgi:hypothetical protein
MHHCFHEKEVDDNLIDVVGHKNKTNMLLIMDKIHNKINTKTIQISSGSLAEGLDLPGSDIPLDVMYVLSDSKVIQDAQLFSWKKK